MNDLIRLAAERAAEAYGGHGLMFNAAGFSKAFVAMSPTSEQLDGHIVRMMLAGRPDIEVGHGSHFRLKNPLQTGG